MVSYFTLVLLFMGFSVEPDLHTTIVFPPYGHCMGIYRAGQEQLSMLLGGMVQFDDPQGLSAVLPDEWDSSDPGDDDELAVYGVNSGTGQIIYNASMYSLGFYGEVGSGNDQLYKPHGIAATTSGIIYVADTGNHRIAVLRRNGQRISPDSFIENFEEPWDVALDGRYIWVTDRSAGTVSRFLSSTDAEPLVISIPAPRGIAATGHGEFSNGHSPFQVVISDNGSSITKIVDGNPVKNIVTSDCGASFFNYVEIDYHGNVWATDSISCVIHKFNSNLEYLDTWGEGYGPADDQFHNPTGISIWDRFGQIFIAESDGARYFWVGSDIMGLDFSADGTGCSISGRLTEKATMIINVLMEDGTAIRNLYSGRKTPGYFSFNWDGTTLQGAPVPEGQYTLYINIEPIYSSRTYFDKTWLRDFQMNESDIAEVVEENEGVRRR